MLSRYQDNTAERFLDRIEFEKLCVLFFRAQINNRNFGEEIEFDEGCYGIAYSYYGPRVSSSTEMYTVPTESALVTDFIGQDYIKKQYGKYSVDSWPDIKDSNLYAACEFFAMDFAALHKVFRNHPYKKENNPWNQYVHTYDQYLTLLAIGDNRKNQILSLCAEIYQITRMKDEMFFEDIAHINIEQYRLMLSGLNSGLWKFHCFKGNALKQTTDKIGSYGGLQALRGIHSVKATYDLGNDIVSLRDEMGEFLYRAVYILNELLIISERMKQFSFRFLDGESMAINNNKDTIFRVSDFYFYKDIKHEIDNSIKKSVNSYGADETIKTYFYRISQGARYMLDKCDLFLKSNNPKMDTVKEFIVAYSLSGSLPARFEKSTETVVDNLTETSKIAVFSIGVECIRDAVIDNLIVDTQDIDDCFYLYVTPLKNDFEGYVQFDNRAKGTNIAKYTKNLINSINNLPNKRRRLFVLRGNETEDSFTTFNETRVNRLQETVLDLEKYCLDLYSIEREKIMKSNKTNTSMTTIIGEVTGGVIVGGKDNSQTNTVISKNDENLNHLLKAVLAEATKLPPEEQEYAKDCAETIRTEASSPTPRKSILKIALKGLKGIVTSVNFVSSVMKLAPVVEGLISKLPE